MKQQYDVTTETSFNS